MDFPQKIVTVNLCKLQYTLMKEIASELVAEGGTIFGGYVRDMMIHDHYAALFYEKYEGTTDSEKYSDPTFDPETMARLLVPKDIDVFFLEKKSQVHQILDRLKKPERENETTVARSVYSFDKDIKHLKTRISFPSASKFLGRSLAIQLDILYSTENVEPPFTKCDLECNAFLMDAHGIRLSRSIGCRLDDVPSTDPKRKREEMRIIRDLLEFKTMAFQVPRFSEDRYNDKYNHDDMSDNAKSERKRKIQRMLNMLCRGWTITNIPLSISKYPPGEPEECNHCRKIIPTRERGIAVNCCGVTVDTHCLSAHVLEELDEKIKPQCINQCVIGKKGWDIFTTHF